VRCAAENIAYYVIIGNVISGRRRDHAHRAAGKEAMGSYVQAASCSQPNDPCPRE
jgi:hypothetical protein